MKVDNTRFNKPSVELNFLISNDGNLLLISYKILAKTIGQIEVRNKLYYHEKTPSTMLAEVEPNVKPSRSIAHPMNKYFLLQYHFDHPFFKVKFPNEMVKLLRGGGGGGGELVPLQSLCYSNPFFFLIR